jgi:hypothetical protein
MYQKTKVLFRLALVLMVLVACLSIKTPLALSQTCSTVSFNYSVVGGLVSAPTSGSTIYKDTPQCVVDTSQATVSTQAIPDFLGMKAVYYDQAKASSNLIKTDLSSGTLQSKLTANKNKNILISTTGNLTVGTLNFDAYPDTTVAVVFVDGDILINQDIIQKSATQGIVFIASGDINIDQSVARVDAVLITFGRYCSFWDATRVGAECGEPSVLLPTLKALTINGSIISLTQNSLKAPKFVRNIGGVKNTSTPAEVVNYQPKYLAILKEVFGRTTKIWSEETGN